MGPYFPAFLMLQAVGLTDHLSFKAASGWRKSLKQPKALTPACLYLVGAVIPYSPPPCWEGGQCCPPSLFREEQSAPESQLEVSGREDIRVQCSAPAEPQSDLHCCCVLRGQLGSDGTGE